MPIALARPIPSYPEPGESSDFEVTLEEYSAMPVTNQHVEVIDGVVFGMAGPMVLHQIVTRKITFQLNDVVETTDLGLVLQSPLDVVIRKYPKLRVRQPDVLYYSNAKAGLRVLDRLDLVQDGTIPPDLVVEVLSPGQNERTLADKLADYASIGVQEIWFADQEATSIRVLRLDAPGYRLVNEFHVGERLISAVLPTLQFEISEVFRS